MLLGNRASWLFICSLLHLFKTTSWASPLYQPNIVPSVELLRSLWQRRMNGIRVRCGLSMTQDTWVPIKERTCNSGKKRKSCSGKLPEVRRNRFKSGGELAKGLWEGSSDEAIVTTGLLLANLVPRTSGRRGSPLVKEHAVRGGERGPQWIWQYQFSLCSLKTRDTSTLQCARERQRTWGFTGWCDWQLSIYWVGLGNLPRWRCLCQDWK